jgi:hypothetical protein
MDPKKKTLLPKQTNKNSGCQKCQELEDFGKLSLYLSISLSLSLSLSLWTKTKLLPKKTLGCQNAKMFEGFGNFVAKKKFEDLV